MTAYMIVKTKSFKKKAHRKAIIIYIKMSLHTINNVQTHYTQTHVMTERVEHTHFWQKSFLNDYFKLQ